MRDNKSNVQTVDLGKITLSGTTPGASAWVDTKGFDGVTIELFTDTVTDAGTASGFATEMQESDTTAAADATAVADAEILGSESDLTVTADGDDDKLIGALGYVGNSRYVRFNLTGTTGTAAVVRIVARLSYPAQAPTTYVGTSVAAT